MDNSFSSSDNPAADTLEQTELLGSALANPKKIRLEHEMDCVTGQILIGNTNSAEVNSDLNLNVVLQREQSDFECGDDPGHKDFPDENGWTIRFYKAAIRANEEHVASLRQIIEELHERKCSLMKKREEIMEEIERQKENDAREKEEQEDNNWIRLRFPEFARAFFKGKHGEDQLAHSDEVHEIEKEEQKLLCEAVREEYFGPIVTEHKKITKKITDDVASGKVVPISDHYYEHKLFVQMMEGKRGVYNIEKLSNIGWDTIARKIFLRNNSYGGEFVHQWFLEVLNFKKTAEIPQSSGLN